MEPSELCVPIYLNQQIVFDLLAILDDGFSQFSQIRTAEVDSETKKSGVVGSIGVSNVFGLLGVSFGGEKGKEKAVTEQKEISTQKVHTPTSLFAKLRGILYEKELLKKIQANTKEEVNKLTSELEGGQFVEFRAILKKNPLVETIEGFKQIMQMAVMFTDTGGVAQKTGKQMKAVNTPNSNQLVMKQLEGMLSGLTQSNSLEIIGEILDISGMKAVLSAKLDYFSDRNASEIIDGEFRVLGKVIRVIGADTKDSINLLRKTSFGRFDANTLKQFADSFEDAKKSGITFPEFITEIKGPALQVVPIAIFT